ncbi:hypothetical protein Q9L58_004132 [Maublancomyces gigas]|uniref:Dehydrin n=1 Tax=Discina gigas TaxID=1032678 RepID=A0ABR3GM79_9PEZI
MDSIYSAASSASRAVFGDTNDDPQNLRQNPGQQRTAGHTATADDRTPRTTETKPFRGTGSSNDGSNPFRYASDTDTTATAYPSGTGPGTGFGSSGTQHTAGSAGPTTDHRIDLNKPIANIYESRSAGSGKPDYPATHASGGNQPTTTTSSILDKPLGGGLNKDGVRHEAAGIQQPLGASDHSDGRHKRLPGAFPVETSEAQRSLRSNLHEDSTHTQPGTGLTGTHQPTAPDSSLINRDRTHGTHEHGVGSGVQPSTGVASTFPSSTTGEHRVPGISDNRDRTHQSGVDHRVPGISDSRDRTHQSGTGLEGGRDGTHDLHHKVGSVTNPHMDQSHLHDNLGASTMGEHGVSGISDNRDRTHQSGISDNRDRTHQSGVPTTGEHHGLDKSSTDTHNPVGLDAHKSSNDAHKSSTDAHQPSTTGTHHTNAPGPGGAVLPVEEKSHESGTGEKYEKSTGVAAEGGDFDASRPGAGREADRLLDERGVHHGPEKKKDVDADKDVHKKALGTKHNKAVGTEHNKTVGTEHNEAVGTDHNKVQETGTEHKGLGEKIKEKLHLGHH